MNKNEKCKECKLAIICGYDVEPNGTYCKKVWDELETDKYEIKDCKSCKLFNVCGTSEQPDEDFCKKRLSELEAKTNCKLSALELAVIEDTLYGSLKLVDGSTLFKFTHESRQKMYKKIMSILGNINVGLKIE